MGWFTKLFSGGDTIKGALEGTGSLAKDLREAITGEISSEKKAELALKAQEIESNLVKMQADINLQEAKGSPFQRNARPFITWTCGLSLLYAFLFRPIFYDLFLQYFHFRLNPIDEGALMNLVVAILGLGAYRTYEKVKGVQDRH